MEDSFAGVDRSWPPGREDRHWHVLPGIELVRMRFVRPYRELTDWARPGAYRRAVDACQRPVACLGRESRRVPQPAAPACSGCCRELRVTAALQGCTTMINFGTQDYIRRRSRAGAAFGRAGCMTSAAQSS